MEIGIQMFSVKGMIDRDHADAFRRVAEVGYKNWEVCQLYGRDDVAYNYGLQMPPDEAKAFIRELGVKVIGSHLTDGQTVDGAYLEEYLSYMEQIGCKAAGLGATFFPYMDMRALDEKIARFNHLGERCKAHGMRFYYHNHFHEFQYFGDKTVYDHLMEGTDPELVWFELDTYWAMRGGQDPVALLNKYGDRICFIHQKDFPRDFRSPANLYSYAVSPIQNLEFGALIGINEPDGFTEVGKGCMDIASIFAAAEQAGVEYAILEQDRTSLTELESIKISYEAISALLKKD